jgi:hypothetical protein
MSLLMMRAAILAQGGVAAPPVDVGTLRQLDTTRRPAGYTLSNGNQTAINTSGGSNYARWVPTARAILPTDGRRYWEVLCPPGGAATFDGYMGVVSAAQREEFNAGLNPITLGSIGWRGTGALWSSTTATAFQQLTGLPMFGAGDVLMFVLDPATARLWIGRNGIWRDDPGSGAATWTTAASPAFYPQVQGRNPGDGGTLRTLPSQFSYPLPPGVRALGYDEPALSVFDAAAFLEIGWDRPLSLAEAAVWVSRGGGSPLSHADASAFLEQGGGLGCTLTQASLYIEVDLS